MGGDLKKQVLEKAKETFVWLWKGYNTLPVYERHELLFAQFVVMFYTYWNLAECVNTDQPFPVGLGFLIDFSPFCSSHLRIGLLKFVFLASGVVWMLNISRVVNLVSLFFVIFCPTAYHTVRNGSGTSFHTNQLPVMIYITQWFVHLYYYRKSQQSKKKRDHSASSSSSSDPFEEEERSMLMNVAQQVLCAGYVSCAIAKDYYSNGLWVKNAHFFTVTMVGTNERWTYNNAVPPRDWVVGPLLNYLLENPWVASWFFSPGFYFEALFPLCMYNRFTRLLGGIGCWMMHHLIYITMRLAFDSFKFVLIAYFMAPTYWISVLWTWKKTGLWPQDRINVRASSNVNALVAPSSRKNKPLWRRFVKSFPLKTAVVLLAVLWIAKENFPFSHFPVYASPKPYHFYFRVVDKNDNPLYHLQYFYLSGGQFNKLFERLCDNPPALHAHGQLKLTEERFRECGDKTLAFIASRVRKAKRRFLEDLKPLRLIYVQHNMYPNGTITRMEKIAGELMPTEKKRSSSSATQQLSSNASK